MAPKKKNSPSNAAIAAAIRNARSNTSSAVPTPTKETPTKEPNPLTPVTEAPTKEPIKEPIKINTDVQSVVQNRPRFNQLSPSVRDVAEHAAALKSILDRLNPIYSMVEKEASRIDAVSPLLVRKDQVRHASVVGISDINLFLPPSWKRRGVSSPQTRGSGRKN